jgi:hypothetical protein
MTVVVIPCGNENPQYNTHEDLPYELTLTKMPN